MIDHHSSKFPSSKERLSIARQRYASWMAKPIHNEPHDPHFAARLNWLRAGVLGANDGIVSIAALVVGVAAATTELGPIVIAGVAGVLAGSISMALGEYVSVSSQRDSEASLIEREKRELQEQPEEELQELVEIYEAKGLSKTTARTVAEELTAIDPIKAHLEAELGISEQQLTNPWHAALSSAVSFLAGALLPMLAVIFTPVEWRIPVTVLASLLALVITGGLGAYLGRSPMLRPVIRVAIGGGIALSVTWAIGALIGSSAIL